VPKKKSDKLCVLVTGVGAPGTRGTLYALKKNPDRTQLRLIGIDGNPDALGKIWVEKFYKVPFPEQMGYLKRLLEICRKESVDVVLPQTTREIAFLSKHRDEFRSRNMGICVSGSKAIETANNKFLILKVFQKLKLPHPRFHLAKSKEELERAISDLGYPKVPVVVKPPISNGMRGYRELRERNSWDAKRFLREKPSNVDISLKGLIAILSRGGAWPELLVSEYLPGQEYSVDAFVGKNASVAIPRLRKSIVNGISFESVSERREDLIDYTLKIAKEIGLEYAFGFQFKLDEERVPNILECNPRIQGTMVASVFSGFNVIWFAVREALGRPPTISFSQQEILSARFARYWGGVGFEGGRPIDEI